MTGAERREEARMVRKFVSGFSAWGSARTFRLCLALGLALAAAPPPAAAGELAPAFADVASATQDGKTRSLAKRGAATLRVSSYRLTPARGASADATAMWCGVRVSAAGAPEATLVTVGRGPLEALSCDRLREAGDIPARAGERRVALIYDARSPNAASRAVAILTNDGSAGWRLDEAATERAGALPGTATLRRLRSAQP
jgi:hypothetical protein